MRKKSYYERPKIENHKVEYSGDRSQEVEILKGRIIRLAEKLVNPETHWRTYFSTIFSHSDYNRDTFTLFFKMNNFLRSIFFKYPAFSVFWPNKLVTTVLGTEPKKLTFIFD